MATALSDTRWRALCCDGWDVARGPQAAVLTEDLCRLDLFFTVLTRFSRRRDDGFLVYHA